MILVQLRSPLRNHLWQRWPSLVTKTHSEGHRLAQEGSRERADASVGWLCLAALATGGTRVGHHRVQARGARLQPRVGRMLILLGPEAGLTEEQVGPLVQQAVEIAAPLAWRLRFAEIS